jgi:sec-independent protein translocase protein TatB
VLGGLGWPEAAVLLLLGLFVFGPERLPGIAADAGRTLRRLRTYLKGMSDELKSELGPEVADLDLRSLHPREFVRKHLLEDDPEEQLPGVPAARQRVLLPGEPPPWDPDAT